MNGITVCCGRQHHCFFGFFRSGEITVASERAFDKGAQLTFDDIKVDCLQSPKHLKIRLKESKTDQRREGTDVFISRHTTSYAQWQ